MGRGILAAVFCFTIFVGSMGQTSIGKYLEISLLTFLSRTYLFINNYFDIIYPKQIKLHHQS